LDIKDIKTLIDLMRKNDLSTFKMEKEGFKITLKRGGDEQTIVTTVSPGATMLPAAVAPAAPPAGALAAPAAPAAASEPAPTLREITSPMVGTFYSAASPDSPAFIQVGQSVTPDTVVCIVEAMKVMNEIKAETSGVVAEICVENGKPVQFGQALFKLK